MSERIIAVLAAISLGVLDYFVIALLLMMEGDLKPAIVAAVIVAGFVVTVLLRQPWLIFVSQNCISILMLVRAIQFGERLRLANVVVVVGMIESVICWLG